MNPKDVFITSVAAKSRFCDSWRLENATPLRRRGQPMLIRAAQHHFSLAEQLRQKFGNPDICKKGMSKDRN